MPLDNTLNVSELLRRLGVKGDSLGSASLLEALRLNIMIADMSQLVPPMVGAMGGAALQISSGVGNFNNWSLLCRAPGGLRVTTIRSTTNRAFDLFVGPTLLFDAVVTNQIGFSYASGQITQSAFRTHTPTVAKNLPNNTLEMGQNQRPNFGIMFDNYVGPGEFFMIESEGTNSSEEIVISWTEYPGAISPAQVQDRAF